MELKKLNDETLLHLITRAQQNALSELYDRYNRLVYSLALHTTGDASLAEEITQDVFMRVWDKASTYNSEQGKVATWIGSIARYRSIDMLRQARIRPEGNQIEWADEIASQAPDSNDVERSIAAAQQQEAVRSAVNQLPPEQRVALAYAFFHGYSHTEIANILNQPIGTVKTRIRLAVKKLRQLLGDEHFTSK